MAENEEEYLRQCLERNICPVCQQSITKKFVKLKGPGSNISARVHTCPVARASILMAYRCTSCNAATTANPASLMRAWPL